MKFTAKTRRQHTKSKRGCVQCKTRHVKCDEERPVCALCRKLDLQCSWRKEIVIDYPRAKSAERQQTVEPQPGTPSQHGLSRSEPPISSQYEVEQVAASLTSPLESSNLQLLHHWTLDTAGSLSEPTSRHLWQSRLVELGFHHPFLLHAILAVAAVHKATLVPGRCSELYHQSLLHMDCTINGFSNQLGNPNIELCSPLFATASLITIHSLASAQVQPPADPIAALCDWMHLLRGVGFTLQQNWDQVASLDIAPLVSATIVQLDLTQKVPEVDELQRLVGDPQYTSIAIREACLQAVDELRSLLLYLKHGVQEGQSMISIALSWPARLAPQFIDLMVEREPIALVILAYYTGMLGKHVNSWFVRGWSRMIIDSVESTIQPPLHGWLTWPRQCLESRAL